MKKITAIKHFGNASRLAEALNIEPQAVSQWGEDVPKLRAYELELITGGVLKRIEAPEEYKKSA